MEKTNNLYSQYWDQIITWGNGLEQFYPYGVFFLPLVIYWLIFVFYNEKYFMPARKRAELTFKIYQNQMLWLKMHDDCRNWIKNLEGPLGPNYAKYDFDEYLRHFESLYSLRKIGLLDEELKYDLFCDVLISVYEANNYELERLIKKMRKENGITDYYEGVEILYKNMKQQKNIKLKKLGYAQTFYCLDLQSAKSKLRA
jgi:hypothetical protein